MDGSLDRTCPEFGFISYCRKESDGLVGQFEVDAVCGEHFFDPVDLQPDNLLYLLLVEGQEHDDVVYTVQELGAYRLLQHFDDLVLCLVDDFCPVLVCDAVELLLDVLAAEV